MAIKEVKRNIPEKRENCNDRFRVRYKDKSAFDLLIVKICRLKTNETQIFKFDSKELPDKDSIHFSTSIENGKFKVNWQGISTKHIILKSEAKKTNVENEPKKNTDKDYVVSFPPIVGELPKVLILGTMPGKDSLRYQEYYANLRNSFWKIIFCLLNAEIPLEYKDKTDLLKRNGISIWDVCHKAIRQTSLDSDIEAEIPNTIKEFLNSKPSIRTIVFNGQKAEKLYSKYFDKFKNIRYITLLSTSPANASYSFEEKLNDWKKILKPNT